jgi:heat-inducible transcriptional repressor
MASIREDLGSRLKEREKKILYLTVYYYISTGEPVGSRFLSKKLDLDLSPATIRNIMADLEASGLLRQTHPSSGRIPTDMGYRCYVDLLVKSRKPRPLDIRRIQERFSRKNREIDEIIKETSKTLSVISRHLSVVLAPRFIDTRFEHMEFLRVGPGRILAIFVSDPGLVQNKLLEMESDWGQEELSTMARMWNERFSERPLREVRVELMEMMEEDRAEYGILFKRALELGRRVLTGEVETGDLYTDGAANIFAWPEFASPAKMRHLIEAIEEKSKLLQLLDRVLESEGTQVFIGGEMPLPELRELSLITAPYRREGQNLGVLGVIGPTRMEYAKIIPIVAYTASSLSEYLNLG